MARRVKDRTLSLCADLGVFRAARRVQRQRSVVLTYHGVLSGADDSADYLNNNFVCAAAFERHMVHLAAHYRPIALSALVDYHERRVPPLDGSAAVTFDDGFANIATVAWPILQKCRIPFTVFLTTGMIDRPDAMLWTERAKRAIYLSDRPRVMIPIDRQDTMWDLGTPRARADAAHEIIRRLKRTPQDRREAAVAAVELACGRPALNGESDRERYEFLSWDQVREMASAGVEFGSHTVSHPILSGLTEQELWRELAESKETIARAIGSPCTLFAYPNGGREDFGTREKATLQALGYRAAFSLTGTLNTARSDPYALDRVNISRQFDRPLFEATLTGLRGRLNAVRDAVRKPLNRG